ncbi:TAP-like protein-domain-containing protein [Aspergillus pseudoustus]|uniref:TAP-like protein-domain-containing protein n=1 Tax=Aspergillus pseudoustus TaxID=1810923 RepID=A0ABR4IA18_9EURO
MLPLYLLQLATLSSAASIGGSIRWDRCTVENFPALATLPGLGDVVDQFGNASHLDCGELQVPLDWNRPRGEKITIGMARYRATKPGKRLGSYIYNPGGPGGPGSLTVLGQAIGQSALFNRTSDYYDVIGLDPRGIGLSTRVKCDPDAYNKYVSIFPKTEDEFEALVAKNTALGESCRDKTGELFYHLDTTQAAKDLEAVRIGLREKKLNWLGFSYGTQLGGAYAELFPEHVGRMVLDGNLDHSQTTEADVLRTEASTYEDVLNQFFLWCNTIATSDECPLKGQDLPQLYDELVAAADESPIDVPACTDGNTTVCRSPVTGEDIRITTQDYLIYEATFPTLAQALNDTLGGDAIAFASTRLAAADDSPYFPDIAIGCLDWRHESTSLTDLLYKYQLGRYVAPHLQGASQSYRYQASCIGWPAPLANPPHKLNSSAMAKAPPMLMVNAIHDPSTSYVWAHALLEQIPSAVLLTRNGNGHTSYSLGGEAADAIDAFLINGTLPAPNTVVDS